MRLIRRSAGVAPGPARGRFIRHSNLRASRQVGNPRATAATLHGRQRRVDRAPPLRSPLCCRSRRTRSLVAPQYVCHPHRDTRTYTQLVVSFLIWFSLFIFFFTY